MTSSKNNSKHENSTHKKNNGHGGARQGSGRKAFEPTDKQRQNVETMAGYGVPVEQIAALMGIGDDTLRKYFAHEILVGKAKVNTKVGMSLAQQAMAGNTAAAIWWSKSQMGWTEKHEKMVLEVKTPEQEMADDIDQAEQEAKAQLESFQKKRDIRLVQ